MEQSINDIHEYYVESIDSGLTPGIYGFPINMPPQQMDEILYNILDDLTQMIIFKYSE